jgi:Zn finger protein HypA/HybF involved in hydrogenase expression
MGRFLGFQDEEVDNEGDQIGIALKEKFYCGNCRDYMEETGHRHFRCSGCGQDFDDDQV